jgi:diguanylate cyclase (GGDEF)-like protein
MRDVLRGEDVYGRWGGDEFVVVLPATTNEDMRAVAERLREATRAVRSPEIGLGDGIHMSIGAAISTMAMPEEIINAADLALYEDKAERRAAREERVATADLAG